MELKLIYFDFEEKEADVLVRNNVGEFLCYIHPINTFDDLTKKFVLIAFLARNVKIADNDMYLISKISGDYYSFFFQGKLIDANMIEIGDVNIKINDYIPNDIGIGDFVSFECNRVDWCFQ